MRFRHPAVLIPLLTLPMCALAQDDYRFPPEEKIPRYTAYRVEQPPVIDGRLDESAWRQAPRSPRFVDLVTGKPAALKTEAAVLWDDTCLYIGFWVEEPDVRAKYTEHGSPIYYDNDVEVFIAGRDAYYEFEINALNTRYEVFFVWEREYERGGYSAEPALQRARMKPFNGIGYTRHPRGPRLGSWDFRFPGIRTAVHIDGTLNESGDVDRGWTVELAFPWKGMEWLARADQRALPPRDGDVWWIDFSRFNQKKHGPEDSGGWAWSPHFIWDSHIPECFPRIRFDRRLVSSREAGAKP